MGNQSLTEVDKACLRGSIFLVALCILSIFMGCNSQQDSHYIPYAIKALDVWVYDNDKKQNYFAGRIETDYSNRITGLSQAVSKANAVAAQYHLRDWSYVCCTVTPSSGCATKVR